MLSRGELRSNTTRRFMLLTETGLIQYCEKVMRANFDEFRLLFSRIFNYMSAKFRAIFRVAQCDIWKKMRQNYANSFEISK